MTFEEKLVALRKEKGLSQLQLAEQLNVSRQAVSRWESGAAMPTVDNLVYLSRLYGVSLDALLNTGLNRLRQMHRTPPCRRSRKTILSTQLST